jgi:hypothetical protein
MRKLSAVEELGVAGGEVVVPGSRYGFSAWEYFGPTYFNFFFELPIPWDFVDGGSGGGGGEETASPPVPDSKTMAAWDVTEWTDFFAAFTKDWSKAKAAAFTAALATLSQHPVCKVVGVDDYLKAMSIWIPTGDPFWMAMETRNELNEWPKSQKEIFVNLVVEALGVIKDAGG